MREYDGSDDDIYGMEDEMDDSDGYDGASGFNNSEANLQHMPK